MNPLPLDAAEATRLVIRCGVAAASLAGLRAHVESSPASESRYLHVKRGDHWFGFRVSCHAAAYNCCHDYEQLLLHGDKTTDSVRAAGRRLASRIQHGGLVVADPREVADAIRRLGAELVRGKRYRDRRGGAWRWDGQRDCWSPQRTSQSSSDGPPRHRPHARLTPRLRCEVRHARNVIAAWCYEEESRSTL